jgi:hypothetical protein
MAGKIIGSGKQKNMRNMEEHTYHKLMSTLPASSPATIYSLKLKPVDLLAVEMHRIRRNKSRGGSGMRGKGAYCLRRVSILWGICSIQSPCW